jgi:hypothetical protein
MDYPKYQIIKVNYHMSFNYLIMEVKDQIHKKKIKKKNSQVLRW